MHYSLHIILVLTGAIAGALFGFPVADYMTPVLSNLFNHINQIILLISTFFVDDPGWATCLFDFHDYLFTFNKSFPSVIFYIKSPPFFFYIILVLYEICWTYIYLKFTKDTMF
jgi:hypothetical protein